MIDPRTAGRYNAGVQVTKLQALSVAVFALTAPSGCKKQEADSGPALKPVPTAPLAPGASAAAPANPHQGQAGMAGGPASPHQGMAANPQASGGAAPAGGKPTLAVADGVATIGAVTLKMPEGWQGRPSASSMRAGEISVPAADGDTDPTELIIYYFGNAGAGSVEANIDRWLGQFAQPDGKPSREVAKVAQKKVGDIPITTVDVRGQYVASMTPGAAEKHNKPSFGLLAAIVESPGGALYFKMIGPDKTVTAATPAFHAMLDSIAIKK